MASLRSPALRTLVRVNNLAPARAQQRRWAQVHDVRFLATHRDPSSSVLEKYREKLSRKAREYVIFSDADTHMYWGERY